MMSISKILVRAGVAALLASQIYSGPAMADGVRSAQRDGYGRLVFDWDTPVRYAAEVVNGTLVVQFERPVGSDVAPVTQALGQYVTGSRFSPDRKTLTFTLRPNISMRTFTVGSAVVLDLVSPQAPATAATPAP
ncbi:MAG: tetratricopeptide repeat protein, partial [Rhodospirillaceae bacterium]|nr:tetratricopeptide repeat protein [Rhodospirillaceae bacterium]